MWASRRSHAGPPDAEEPMADLDFLIRVIGFPVEEQRPHRAQEARSLARSFDDAMTTCASQSLEARLTIDRFVRTPSRGRIRAR